MVSRIEVIPEEVRGYGNIMKVKDVDDFSLVNSVLSLTDGVYNLTAESGPSPTPTYDGVSLSSDKSILSYADSETCTLTAQLLDGSTPVSASGVTVEFFKGSTSLGTADTNSSGVATKSYASAGSGDVSLTAEVGSLVSETYSIEDCYLYDDASSDKSSNYTKTSGVTITQDTDHYIFSTTGSNQFISFMGGQDKVRFEMKVMPKTDLTQNSGINIGNTTGTFNSCVTCYTRTGNTIAFNKHSGTTYGGIENYSYTWSLDTYYTFFVEVDGSSVKIGVLDGTGTLIRQNTVSMSITNKYLKFVQTNGTVVSWVKDIKVKPL